MKSLRGWFNIYFVCALAALAVVGCKTHPHYGKKQIATIRLYLQTRNQDLASSGKVLVTRAHIPVTIEADPFLDESDLSHARLIDEADGTYAIELKFNDHGAAALEMTTIGNRGLHIVIFSHFPPPGTKQDLSAETADSVDSSTPQTPSPTPSPDKPRRSGWISIVTINGRLTGGTLLFTPDTSRDEAQTIVTGLNNVAAKNKKS